MLYTSWEDNWNVFRLIFAGVRGKKATETKLHNFWKFWPSSRKERHGRKKIPTFLKPLFALNKSILSAHISLWIWLASHGKPFMYMHIDFMHRGISDGEKFDLDWSNTFFLEINYSLIHSLLRVYFVLWEAKIAETQSNRWSE